LFKSNAAVWYNKTYRQKQLCIIQDKWGYRKHSSTYRLLMFDTVSILYRTHSSTYKTAYTDGCKTYRTVTVQYIQPSSWR